MRVLVRFAWLGAALLCAPAALAQSLTPIGVWQHANGRVEVEISPCADRLCGHIVWFRWPNDAAGLPLVDLKNPDPVLRARPLLGLTVLIGLRSAGTEVWDGGAIYNPNDGQAYQALVSIQDDGALRLRAFALLPLLGKTEVWTRVR